MRKVIGAGLFVLTAFVAALALGQSTSPGTNTPLMGCIEGRALRIVNGYPACSTTVPPAVSSCGSGATMSAQATDFVGQVTTGTGIVTACTVTFSKLYASLGCLAQTNTTASLVAGTPVLGTSGTGAAAKTTMTIALTLSLAAGRITYTCFPV